MDHIIVDCETGASETVPMSSDEIAALQQTQADAAAAEQARQEADAAAHTQRQHDADTLMAALPTQEARDALARLLGL